MGSNRKMVDSAKNFSFSSQLCQKLQDTAFLKSEFAQGKKVKDLVSVDIDTLAILYGRAYKLIEKKKYEEAVNAFLFLTFIDEHNFDFWLGFGMALQMCHKYEAAIDAYELAAIQEMENPVSYFYLAKCLFAIHDRSSALQALEMAIEYADSNPEYADLKQQALSAKDVLLESGS